MTSSSSPAPVKFPDQTLSRLSPIPDISSGPRRLAAAAALTIVVGLVLAIRVHVRRSYGDTDDAMRLFMVRDLLSGRGWYDQLITRLAPPHGVYMHWSRLVDGGLAGAVVLARLVTPPATAEWLVRVIWPLTWIYPTAFSALTIARNVGGRSAVFLTGLWLFFNLTLYEQFIPGRIDHHNIQIAMALLALAGATSRSHPVRWAILAGAAGGLGLGVGLEALVFQALVGVSFAARLALDRGAGKAVAGYGAALALTAGGVFLVQTPPWRWSLSFCDELALNSVTALTVAGIGLALSAFTARRAPPVVRVTLLAITGAATLGTYLALDPACLHGPFAGIPAQARRLWLDRVGEVQPLLQVMKINRAIATPALIYVILIIGSGVLLLTGRKMTLPRLTTVITLAVATLVGVLVWRMTSYAFWIGAPVVGTVIASCAERRLRGLLAPSAILVFLLSPGILGMAASLAENRILPDRSQAIAEANQQACFDPKAYRQLAALPPGRVLSDIDLGSFILLFTPHSVLTAPYHRMWRDYVEAYAAFEAPQAAAKARTLALRVDYVVDCAGLPLMGDVKGLAGRLRSNETPAWLHEVSPPGAILRLYRITDHEPTS